MVTICTGTATEARRALDEADVSLLTLLDEDSEIWVSYRVRGVPTLYLISDGGVVLMSKIGSGNGAEDDLRGEIERLLRD